MTTSSADAGALRIVIANWTARVAGGAETYLRDLIPVLASRGHQIALWTECDLPSERPLVSQAAIPSWCVASIGLDRALTELRMWEPDVIFTHSLHSPSVEAALLADWPAVAFVHAYGGTCVGGEKAFRVPHRRPCDRIFGPACLALYYPRRCGGLNPITMVRNYVEAKGRLQLLRRYGAVLTASEHMRQELLRHGFDARSVVKIGIPAGGVEHGGALGRPSIVPAEELVEQPRDGATLDCGEAEPMPWRLLWVGRMEASKGGEPFLRALLPAASALRRKLSVRMFGDGRERKRWERLASRVQGSGMIEVAFPGWVSGDELAAAFAECDLLILSSTWPEPYGRVGLEAGRYGVPTAAFAVGGIPEWLENGVNGFLAPGDPPTPEGLSDAIVQCLSDPARNAQLRARARMATDRATFQTHLAALEGVLARVLARKA